MATDLDRLVVSLDADITKLTRQLSRAGVVLDGFDKDVDQRTKRTAKKISDNLGSANDNAGLNYNQFQELGHVARATFESIASGASPFRVLTQEGVKLSAAIGPDGITGFIGDLAESLGGLLSPTRIVAGGVLTIAAAAVYLEQSWSASQDAARLALTGIGQASGATVADINKIAVAASSSGKIATGAARDIATALAGTGRIDVSNIGGITDLAPGFAKLFTGGDLEKAGPELARIFSDPAKGADELDARLGVLDDRTREYIRTLAAQGDRQGAIQVLATAVAPELEKAAAQTAIWARAWNAVKSAADSAGAAVGGALSKGTPQEQAAAAERTRRQAERNFGNETGPSAQDSPLLNNPFSQSRATDTASALSKVTDQAEHLAEVARRAGQQDYFETMDKQANELAKSAGETVRSVNQEGQGLKDLEDRYIALGKAIESSRAAGKLDDPDKARASYDALGQRLQQIKTDYAAGGAAAAAALRQANFQAATAGLSTYERGLRELNRQYDELRRTAIATVDASKLPGALGSIEAARGAATSAFNRESLDRARGEVVVSPGYAQSVVGAESSGNPNAISSSGAVGLGQFTKATWIDQFRRHLSDIAAQIDAQNPGNQAAADAAILALRSNREYQLKLIQTLAQDNAVELAKSGFSGTDRNLYLAHNIGSGGATALLKAERDGQGGTSAQELLDKISPTLVANNRAYYGNGKTVDQALATVQARISGGTSTGKAQTNAAISEQQSAEAYGKTAAEAERLKSITEQLNEARERGDEVGLKFKTAQDLEAASSKGLTGELKSQTDIILANADARAKAAGAGLQTRFQVDTANAYGALGRTSEQQSSYTQAKQYGTPGTDEFSAAYDGLQRLQQLNDAKTATGGFLKGMVSDLQNGVKFTDALKNAFTKLISTIADKAIDSLVSNLFGGLFGGGSKTGATGSSDGGGILGGIGSLFGGLFGHADGGHINGPGTGRSDSIPAWLSNGEFVVNADATRANLPLLHAINGGRLPRFANGGIVGTPSVPMARPAKASPVTNTFVHSPNYTIAPAGGVTIPQMQAALRAHDQDINRTIGSRMNKWSKRYG